MHMLLLGCCGHLLDIMKILNVYNYQDERDFAPMEQEPC